VVKTAWKTVSKGQTSVPVWDPPEVGPLPRRQFNDTTYWGRCVAVDTNYVTEGALSEKNLPCGADSRRLPVVPLSRFYYIPLGGGQYAVLVGLHVTTKEIPDWVWLTIWWHDQPNSGPYAANRPASLEAPWTNYLMDTTMSAVTPHESDDQPKICFNPWLEGQLTYGLTGNCINCHRKASFPITDGDRSNVTRGNHSVRNSCAVSLDFLWSLSDQPAPTAGLPPDCAQPSPKQTGEARKPPN
jgi:hypothetical protein